jgi:PDZ domain-containing protein
MMAPVTDPREPESQPEPTPTPDAPWAAPQAAAPAAPQATPGPAAEPTSAPEPWPLLAGTPGDPFGVDPDDAPPAPPPAPRSVTLSVASVALSLLLAVGVALPLPYAIEAPGPTLDTLGSQGTDKAPLIQITGAETYPTTGQLRMVTVATSGGPGYPVTLGDVLRSWLSRSDSTVPVETLFPPEASRDDIDKEGQAQMSSSQENATVSALEELGYQVPTTMLIDETMTGTGAEGVLRKGDVIVALDGTDVVSMRDLARALDARTPGDTVQVGVERDGQRVDVPVVTREGADGTPAIGVYIDPSFDYPVTVSFSTKDIGGPSAGTMFALGIIDKLTPADEANGQVIAGTGTMDLTGTVGAISGIRQKMIGATRDGARWFLAPAGNCDEVVGHVPTGLRVVRISTLHDARLAVEAIGKDQAQDLPTCS